MPEIVLAAALLLAFVNGANDNMKGVATLYGSRELDYRKALAVATLSTALGSLASITLATGLVHAFSGKGLVPDAVLDPALLASVGLAAAATVLLATRLGLPVSTTHALVGGICGAGWVAVGSDLNLAALGGTFALPLAAGPALAIGLAFAGLRAGGRAARRLGLKPSDCVCLGREWVSVGSPMALAVSGTSAAGRTDGSTARQPVTIGMGDAVGCEHRYGRAAAAISLQSAVSAGHLLSASLVGFARGLNDTPKILGLLVGAAVLSPVVGALAITAAMGLGGILAARRVAETLGKRITPMTPDQGLVANLVTSVLVIGASRFGLPVSTTHVSTGAIAGIGAGQGRLRRHAAGEILAAWVTTLPLAMILGAAAMWGLR